MKDTELRKVSIAAIDAWGMDEQLLQLQEEAAELIAAASHYRRGAGRSQELLEEIADIEIMLDQMHVVFGDDAIAIAASPKIERLCGRLAIDYQKRGER